MSALLWFVPFVVLPVAGVVAIGRSWPSSQAWATALAARYGAFRAAIAVALAGACAVLVCGYLLGELLALFESSVDVPAFRWAQGHQLGWWTDVNQVLTQMGSRLEAKLLAVVAIVVFAVLVRPFWLAPALLAGVYGMERVGQQVLAHLVDRGHPPTTLGTYPSGGCARVVAVYGAVALLLTVAVRLSRRWQITLWSVVAVAASVEGYTRIYLLKHWATDAVGGWLFGAMVLAVAIATLAVLRESGTVTARWPATTARTPETVATTAGRGTDAPPVGRGR